MEQDAAASELWDEELPHGRLLLKGKVLYGGNPREHRKSMQTPRRKALPQPGIKFRTSLLWGNSADHCFIFFSLLLNIIPEFNSFSLWHKILLHHLVLISSFSAHFKRSPASQQKRDGAHTFSHCSIRLCVPTRHVTLQTNSNYSRKYFLCCMFCHLCSFGKQGGLHCCPLSRPVNVPTWVQVTDPSEDGSCHEQIILSHISL